MRADSNYCIRVPLAVGFKGSELRFGRWSLAEQGDTVWYVRMDAGAGRARQRMGRFVVDGKGHERRGHEEQLTVLFCVLLNGVTVSPCRTRRC
jgi:hypothetical protein